MSPPGWAVDYIAARPLATASLLLHLLLPLLSTLLWVRRWIAHGKGSCVFGVFWWLEPQPTAGGSALHALPPLLPQPCLACTARAPSHLAWPPPPAAPQVRPMSQELLGLSEQQLALAQAGALLATAAAMASNLRTLLQRYLDRGLTGGCSV